MHQLEELRSGKLRGSKHLKLVCGLKEFPKEIFDLADTLEILDLSGNHLSELPMDFGKLSKLKIAFFSDNQFTELPKVLADCTQLEMIGFKSNQISVVHAESIPLQTRWLILTNNLIEEFPKSIGRCYRLQKCALAGNKLRSLPSEMANCVNLELLRISANQLDVFPDWLKALPKLTWLAIAGNKFNSSHQLYNSLPKVSWSDLEIQHVLGTGASGIISKALWKNANKEIAVKIFKGEVTSDGLPHDEMLSCIEAGTHNHLVKVIGQLQNHPEQKEGLLLELIPGDYNNLGMPPDFITCTRDTFMKECVFSINHIKVILRGISSAMMHLHTNHIMHGDLYAHNILINSEAHALLGDFGAATIYENEYKNFFEKIDVRAFGCLMDDLMQRIIHHDKNHPHYPELLQLKNSCLHHSYENRPFFKELSNYFNHLP